MSDVGDVVRYGLAVFTFGTSELVIRGIQALMPSIPNLALRNAQAASPNNDLSDRQNRARLNGRVPDILGTVRSTMDLLSVPYRFFQNHVEVEYAGLVIGRGAYEVSDIRDGATPIGDISGASVEVYGPNTSPMASDEPQLRIGSAITVPLATVKRYDSVNGQVLRPPNAGSFVGQGNVQFVAPNEVHLPDTDTNHDFTKSFQATDTLNIASALYGAMATRAIQVDSRGFLYFVFGLPVDPDGAPPRYSPGQALQLRNAQFSIFDPGGGEYGSMLPLDLSGDYVIESLNEQYIKLVNPAAVNPAWSQIPNQLADDGVTTVYTLLGPQDLSVSDGPPLLDLAGDYTISTVTPRVIILSSPAGVNDDWNKIVAWGASPADMSPILSVSGPRWTDPVTVDMATTDRVIANMVAQGGLYKDDGKNQLAWNVQVQLELVPVDVAGDPTGPAEYFPTDAELAAGAGTIEGSATLRMTRALTLEARPTFTGRCKVRARRVTDADLAFKGTIVDEVKWRDLYASADVTVPHFGDVTTVYAITTATVGALAVKERRLNALVTRKVKRRGVAPLDGDGFSVALMPTNRADDILVHALRDRYIGRRSLAELDLTSIYGAIAAVEAYFGHERAVEFSYTFDNADLSAEETIAAIAEAVFCVAYRRGNVVKLAPELATDDSLLLFNHCNKVPGEVRQVRFGRDADNDGVALEYVDPVDDAVVTYHLPVDESGSPTAVNPRKIQTVGIRAKLQAHFHAWRAWNKIRRPSITTEFEGYQEASTLYRTARIRVTDGSRLDTNQGEVESVGVDGVTLGLSHPVSFEEGATYRIHLQHDDGTVEMMAVTPGASSYEVVLEHTPRANFGRGAEDELAVGPELCARATYRIGRDDDPRPQAFLVTSREPKTQLTSTVTAVAYDPKFYANDLDYANEVVDEEGNPV